MVVDKPKAKREIAEFSLISYDVWGNAKEGWEVNNAHYTGIRIRIEIPNTDLKDWDAHRKAWEAFDRRLVRKLKEAGYLKSGIRVKSLKIDGEADYSIYISDERQPPFSHNYGHGRPECELRRVRD